MINEDDFIKRSSPTYKDGTIVLLKTSTDTLKLLNPNAVALSLGSSTEEGGNIEVYRDGSGNLQLFVDGDAASDAKAFDLYGGAVFQNNVVIGQTGFSTTYQLLVAGTAKTTHLKVYGVIYTKDGIQSYSANAASLPITIDVSGTDAIDHTIKSRVGGSDIIVAQATGDGAGGVTNPAIGLYPGTTPAVQAAHIADPAESIAGNNAAIDAILVALENIGVLASS